jgi:hypothetical protein
MLTEIEGEWKFSGYTHFKGDENDVGKTKACYSLRYCDMNSETRYFDLDWCDDTPFNKTGISYKDED